MHLTKVLNRIDDMLVVGQILLLLSLLLYY